MDGGAGGAGGGWNKPYLPMLELRAHSQAVYGVSQSSGGTGGGDGRGLMLSVSSDETIRLWDVSLGRCVARYGGGLGVAWDVAFGPADHYFATAHSCGVAAVLSVDRPAPLRLLTGHAADVTCVSWHRNATLLVTGSDDHTCRIWDMRTGRCVRLLRGASGPVSAVSLSSDGHSLGAGSGDGAVALWDLGLAKQVFALREHSRPVYSLAFSGDDAVLASGGGDCALKLWDLKGAYPGSGIVAPPFSMKSHNRFT